MKTLTNTRPLALLTRAEGLFMMTMLLACSSEPPGESAELGTGGIGASGGTLASGGTPASDGQQPSGDGTGGAGSGVGGAGMAATGGTSSGGTGGAVAGAGASGGSDAASGGVGAGTTGMGGTGSSASTGGEVGSGGDGPASGGASAGEEQFDAPFYLGADISGLQEHIDQGAVFVDTDGQTKDILSLLKNHGFNYIRLRTFVDPTAPYGYASTANGCEGKPEAYNDQAHIIQRGAEVKAADMGLLVDFHYSDVWADPGNQIVPAAWRDIPTLEGLADAVKAYTKDFLTAAIAAGARPDMVQVGNEITPGMLVHEPGPETDCWGNNPASHEPNGSSSNFANLAVLLKAGIEAVREVDTEIVVMLHIENTDDIEGVRWWVDGVTEQNVDFDVLGLSCYTAFQGPPATWKATFETIAAEHPELSFVIAEYNPERTAAQQVMLDLPNGRGLGTFFWEPTQGGEWGEAMFTWDGFTLTANEADFAEYDAIREMVGL